MLCPVSLAFLPKARLIQGLRPLPPVEGGATLVISTTDHQIVMEKKKGKS